LCGAGKVEPHGLFRLHGTIDSAIKVLFPTEIPAGNRPNGENPRRFVPTQRDVERHLFTQKIFTFPLHLPCSDRVSAPASSRSRNLIISKKIFTSIWLTDLFTLP